MQLKNILVAALAGSASAQMSMNLTAALASNSNLTNLTSFLSNPTFAPLVSALGGMTNLTLLAPSNTAFSKLLNSSSAAMLNNTGFVTALLQYHVLQGSITMFGNLSFPKTALMNSSYANVTGGQVVAASGSPAPGHFTSGLLSVSNISSGPVNFTGGSIYVIDSFLVPPQSVSATATALNATAIVGALSAANLTSAVNGLRDVTIFAPSNSAFAAIGNLNLTAAQLSSALQYHVIQGPPVYYSPGLSNTTVRTMQGSNVTITVSANGAVFVNQARVVVPNILVAGGVVHVIDSVLNPGNSTIMPNASATGGTPAFSGASSGTAVPYTSGVAAASSSVNTASAPGASATKTGAAVPMRTGAIGAAALFGGAAVAMNW